MKAVRRKYTPRLRLFFLRLVELPQDPLHVFACNPNGGGVRGKLFDFMQDAVADLIFQRLIFIAVGIGDDMQPQHLIGQRVLNLRSDCGKKDCRGEPD